MSVRSDLHFMLHFFVKSRFFSGFADFKLQHTDNKRVEILIFQKFAIFDIKNHRFLLIVFTVFHNVVEGLAVILQRLLRPSRRLLIY